MFFDSPPLTCEGRWGFYHFRDLTKMNENETASPTKTKTIKIPTKNTKKAKRVATDNNRRADDAPAGRLSQL